MIFDAVLGSRYPQFNLFTRAHKLITLSHGDDETTWPTIIPMIQCARVVKTERESRERFLNMAVFVNHSKSLDGLTRKNEHFVL